MEYKYIYNTVLDRMYTYLHLHLSLFLLPLLSSYGDGKVSVRRYPAIKKEAPHVSVAAHAGSVAHVKFTCDGRRLLSLGQKDRCLLVWKVPILPPSFVLPLFVHEIIQTKLTSTFSFSFSPSYLLLGLIIPCFYLCGLCFILQVWSPSEPLSNEAYADNGLLQIPLALQLKANKMNHKQSSSSSQRSNKKRNDNGSSGSSGGDVDESVTTILASASQTANGLVGCQVILHGLIERPELNGCLGVVTSFSPAGIGGGMPLSAASGKGAKLTSASSQARYTVSG